MIATAEAASSKLNSVSGKHRFYAPELDSLRFLAFFLVFCRHVATSFGTARHQAVLSKVTSVQIANAANPHYGLSPMWVRIQGAAGAFDFGVCLFFFLSSYLITRLLLIEKEETHTVNVRDFYIRRALRIWPLYFVFLAVVAICGHHLQNITWPRIVASLFFVANWPAVFHGWKLSPIDILWSVSVEEQFYLVWPYFAKRGKQGVLAVSIAMAVIALCTLTYFGTQANTLNSAVWANTFVQCIFFSGGAVAGVFLKPENYTISRVSRLILFGSGITCWLGASMGCNLAREVSPNSINLVAGYVLVLLGVLLIFISFSAINPDRIPKAFTYFGKISYGLYVLHVLFLELSIAAVRHVFVYGHATNSSLIVRHMISAVMALALTMLVASISYKYLESPFLKLKKRFTMVPSRPV